MQAASVSLAPLLQQEFRTELIAIADWWATHSVDHQQGGFYGEISADNQPVADAPKGVILNARILWFFSETAQHVNKPEYRACAARAYHYLLDHFFDGVNGGFFWELDAQGQPTNTKKQIYAQAFVIYALTAYYQLTQQEPALTAALACFELVEKYGLDRERQGYLEAFSGTWGTLDDLRLSVKDLNYPKSQNTHLHILEAYTCLNRVCARPAISAALRYNIELFEKYMIDTDSYHLRMFMDLDWKDFSPGYTYGHDIEASWLIAQALDSLGDSAYTAALTPTLIKIAEVTQREAIGSYGQVMDDFNFASGKVNAEAIWWVQAEALVGFLYAYSVTANKDFLRTAENVWQFIKCYQIDRTQGEWHWVAPLGKADAAGHYKLGFWKCPYHNGRAMIAAAGYLDKLADIKR
jgi:cellobiose epimerase